MNQSCDFHSDALPDYAAGGLEPGRTRALEAHLRECAACRADLEVIRFIGEAGAVKAPAALAEGIIDALRPPPVGIRRAAGEGQARQLGSGRSWRSWRSWRPWALPLAAAAVLAAVWIGVAPGDGARDGEVVVAEEYAPYGGWPAGDGVVAGQAVLSDLTDEQLEQLLEDMET